MRISMSNYIKLNLQQILKNGGLLLGIILAVLPSIAISYSILKLNGPFTILHVASFFCIFGIVGPVVLAASVFLKDFHYGTISMIFNTEKNRIRYFISNSILAALLGGIFGIIGVITLNVLSNLGVTGELSYTFSASFVLNFILCIVFYMLCAYILVLIFDKSSIVYIALITAIEILPNLLESLRLALNNSFFDSVIENVPFYSLLIYLPSGNFGVSQYVNLILSIGLLSVASVFLTVRKDV